ncbi:hypothetical protein OMAG_000463 [Candidatus Omnitrophus magneticus]|uniref:Uncharacterized protein n=1 Tax=Candidatus Omnitrophus magneticus TaxID=1609969 RepID=A0A0F0CUH9_9BACT|nr:hypothetical protein OMAG_000827 [Candidatus Omnitrophus magneticus]KJJ85669.1 hypothetical protein OMAG_000463 [Candidatus Omnitrophus magneticus]
MRIINFSQIKNLSFYYSAASSNTFNNAEITMFFTVFKPSATF